MAWIDFKSQKNKGTTFTIRLPRLKEVDRVQPQNKDIHKRVKGH